MCRWRLKLGAWRQEAEARSLDCGGKGCHRRLYATVSEVFPLVFARREKYKTTPMEATLDHVASHAFGIRSTRTILSAIQLELHRFVKPGACGAVA